MVPFMTVVLVGLCRLPSTVFRYSASTTVVNGEYVIYPEYCYTGQVTDHRNPVNWHHDRYKEIKWIEHPPLRKVGSSNLRSPGYFGDRQQFTVAELVAIPDPLGPYSVARHSELLSHGFGFSFPLVQWPLVAMGNVPSIIFMRRAS